MKLRVKKPVPEWLRRIKEREAMAKFSACLATRMGQVFEEAFGRRASEQIEGPRVH